MAMPEQTIQAAEQAEADALKKVAAEKLEAKLVELAKLSPVEYDQVRDKKARELKIRVGTLDSEVAKRRGDIAEKTFDEVVEEIDPWPTPVDGAALLDSINRSMTRHVILPKGAPTAISLWALGTFCMDVWRVWPKLLITSPEKRCGKSTLMEVIESITYRPMLVSSITAAALFRCIEEWSPTLLIDEADTFAKDNDELNGIINAGHTRRTATVVRAEKDGDGFKPKKFSVWCPQVIAGIKSQRDTLHDRSVHIEMRRKMPGEAVMRLPFDHYENSLSFRRQCLRWSLNNLDRLRSVQPNVPNLGNDRAQDNWTPLFALAEVAGGCWPERTLAAYNLMAAPEDDDRGIGPMILADIQVVFEEKGVDCIWSDDLVDALVGMEERPWCEWKNGKPITKVSLSRILKPFKVNSGDVRFGATVRKGYKREKFVDAWERYLPPPEPPISNATTLQTSQGAGLSGNPKRNTDQNVAFHNLPKTSEDAGCRGVAFQNTDSGDRAGNPYLLEKKGE